MPQYFIAYKPTKVDKRFKPTTQNLKKKRRAKTTIQFHLIENQKLGLSPLEKSGNTLKTYPNAADIFAKKIHSCTIATSLIHSN